MPSVYTTLDYEYRHKNKGTGLVLALRKYEVYKMRPKIKAPRYVLYRLIYRSTNIPTNIEVTNAMSTVYTTLDYGYGHKNKGTGIVLIPRKCGVYKRDQESYKMCTVPIIT